MVNNSIKCPMLTLCFNPSIPWHIILEYRVPNSHTRCTEGQAPIRNAPEDYGMSQRGTRIGYSEMQSRTVHPIGDIAAKWLITALNVPCLLFASTPQFLGI